VQKAEEATCRRSEEKIYKEAKIWAANEDVRRSMELISGFSKSKNKVETRNQRSRSRPKEGEGFKKVVLRKKRATS